MMKIGFVGGIILFGCFGINFIDENFECSLSQLLYLKGTEGALQMSAELTVRKAHPHLEGF